MNNDASSSTGKHDTHDSVMVLFQRIPFGMGHLSFTSKGKVSHYTDFVVQGRRYISSLPCQQLQPFYFGNKSQPLPEGFSSEKFVYEPNEKKEVALQLARNLNLPAQASSSFYSVKVPSWAGCESIISTSDDIPLMKVGFGPTVPYPITDIQTVYTCLRNCDNIASQLRQKTLPVVCDEGVYHLVTKIYLQQPELFLRIFPMLGGFHLTKTALHCAGKFLKGSGVEDIFIECGIFGPKTVDSVMNGKHYYRSLEGLTILSDSMTRMKMKAFWKEHPPQNYSDAIVKLERFQLALCDNNKAVSQSSMSDIIECNTVNNLKQDIDRFEKICSESSSQCKYWFNFLKIMNLIRNFIRSERDGDFLLNMKTIQDLLPVFLGCDSLNYLRYGSFYLELLKNVKHTHPELHDSFLKKHFVVKRTSGSFNAVSPDLALEQTIQRSSKSSHGIIGQTRKQEYAAEWALIYHEVLSITNTFREITNSDKGGNTETANASSHHHLSPRKIQEINARTDSISSYISSQGNPFCKENHDKVKNLVTQVYAEDSVAKMHFDFFEIVSEKYDEFQKSVYKEKTRLLADKISKINLLPVDHVTAAKSDATETSIKKNERASRLAIKVLSIAKSKD